MANIFRKKDAYIDRVNRSTFDLSFVNNLTMKFGAITPVCLLPASFGDSFQINARFNLQLLPTVFPIQTQLYVRLHFVYVRTRTLWEDWMSFFGGDETVTPPWLDMSAFNSSVEQKSMFNIPDDMQTGTLADYLGVPTTITGSYGGSVPALQSADFFDFKKKLPGLSSSLVGTPIVNDRLYGSLAAILSATVPFSKIFVSDPTLVKSYGYETPRCICIPFNVQYETPPLQRFSLLRQMIFDYKNGPIVGFVIYENDDSPKLWSAQFNAGDIVDDAVIFTADLGKSISSFKLCMIIEFRSETVEKDYMYISREPGSPTAFVAGLTRNFASQLNVSPISVVYRSVEWTKPEYRNCPFYTANSDRLPPIPLSALPFRAYEAYYNAFGRDIRNNPFIVDGKPEYNKYVPSVKGGRDTYKYQLRYANWEPDAYTTALQSPQAGIAPLVGITSLGEATFRDAAGTEYHAQLETADDGDTVTGFQVKSSNAPADVVRNLIGMATSGISISDFRNVNSLQRFLEIRIRQSPRYKNLVKGLFDVNLDYDELMMPEFLGGISDTIPVYKVTQTTPTEGNPLGTFAGQGSLQSGMRHVIRKYCPEDGYILGVMSVVPAANYSQLLPPHFTRMNLLDWHFPQFNNISYQPMLYKHLCPYQAYAFNPEAINNVFGYQRAYWDLIASFDEVHGEFRGSMRNFVINRVFDKAPELSKDFLLVNPDHVNDVFAMTAENGDKILGSIAFDITKKTTIPRNSIPHIE
nr:major capsid protein [Microviridae sp.]